LWGVRYLISECYTCLSLVLGEQDEPVALGGPDFEGETPAPARVPRGEEQERLGGRERHRSPSKRFLNKRALRNWNSS
jgi:hypothetical protein